MNTVVRILNYIRNQHRDELECMGLFFLKSLLKYKKINRNDSIKILNKTGQKYKSWQRQTYFFFPCTIGPLGTLYTHGLRSFKEIKLSVQVCVMTACCLLPLFIFSWSSSPETQGSSEWSGCSSSPDPPRTRWQHSPASCYCTDGMTLGMKGHYVCQINTTQHNTHAYCKNVAWLLCLAFLACSISISSCRLYLCTLLSLSSSLSRAKAIISFLFFSSSSAERRLRERNL